MHNNRFLDLFFDNNAHSPPKQLGQSLNWFQTRMSPSNLRRNLTSELGVFQLAENYYHGNARSLAAPNQTARDTDKTYVPLVSLR